MEAVMKTILGLLLLIMILVAPRMILEPFIFVFGLWLKLSIVAAICWLIGSIKA